MDEATQEEVTEAIRRLEREDDEESDEIIIADE